MIIYFLLDEVLRAMYLSGMYPTRGVPLEPLVDEGTSEPCHQSVDN
jgi:hypothetical protein